MRHVLKQVWSEAFIARLILYVTCLSGKIFDVIVDLRKESSTYMNIYATWLWGSHQTSGNSVRLFVPSYCGHGFYADEDDSILLYLQPRCYEPGLDESYNWDSFGIQWPSQGRAAYFFPHIISDKDEQAPPWPS